MLSFFVYINIYYFMAGSVATFDQAATLLPLVPIVLPS